MQADAQRVASSHSFWRPLGELLVEHGLLSPRQLELALAEQARTGRKLGEVLIEFGFLSEAALAGTLLEQVGLAQLEPEPEPAPEPEPERAGSYVVKRVEEEWHRELLAPETQRPLVVRMDGRDDDEQRERRRWWRPAPRKAPKSELERLVADFEVRSREIRENISEIRRALGDVRSLRSES